ncbi:hypothetical protein [Bradyrhizobium sp. sGM-13]|uniref:hypothetical protein n=1 Tax=Bradyrhizobium sp. sGM-13 TaxID=2831781 RepID=UPI001BCD3195|nr:hypothetical protein [Bradyrhizobium sp. sGM-13]
MADPLSTATRATKRNLLVTSVLAISANAFSVSIEKIPIGGLSINFDGRLFAFLLLVVLLYFFCTFVVYYTIDMKNLERTAHEEGSEKSYNLRVGGFHESYKDRTIGTLQQIVGPDLRVISHYDYSFEEPEPRHERGYRLLVLDSSGGKWNEITPSTHPEECGKLDQHFHRWRSRYAKAAVWNRRRTKVRLNVVKLTYVIRNYILDGAIPVLLGSIAILAIFGAIDLGWIKNWLPHMRTISAPQITAD